MTTDQQATIAAWEPVMALAYRLWEWEGIAPGGMSAEYNRAVNAVYDALIEAVEAMPRAERDGRFPSLFDGMDATLRRAGGEGGR